MTRKELRELVSALTGRDVEVVEKTGSLTEFFDCDYNLIAYISRGQLHLI